MTARAPLTIEIVGIEVCEGHHLDLFMERLHTMSRVLRYCDDCAERLRSEIRRAMRDAITGDDQEGLPI